MNNITKVAQDKYLYIETYGCQMNVADSELVVSVMQDIGFTLTTKLIEADVIFVNTCSIRENAEQRVRGRLQEFRAARKKKPSIIIGVIGCMAERLKTKLLDEEKFVDMVVGPDAYRDLPELIQIAESGQKAVNVQLSKEETYADICPVRYGSNGISAFVSIMRGCNNMCSFCVVPFTRGRERSRSPETIIDEVHNLIQENYKEVIIIGQNVDKYNWNNRECTFAQLLDRIANLNSGLRIRFATSYPQDMTNAVLKVMASHKNICKSIHLPVQSGNNRILEKMRRGYTREWYMDRIRAIRSIVPDCAISTDIITGFCSETEEEHKATLSLMEWTGFDFAYMFKYSERPNTFAQRKYEDDVPDEIKTRRLNEIIALQQKLSLQSNENDLGETFEVLIEGTSKKSDEKLFGRNSQNKVVVFPAKSYQKGDFVSVLINQCTPATLIGEIVD